MFDVYVYAYEYVWLSMLIYIIGLCRSFCVFSLVNTFGDFHISAVTSQGAIYLSD